MVMLKSAVVVEWTPTQDSHFVDYCLTISMADILCGTIWRSLVDLDYIGR